MRILSFEAHGLNGLDKPVQFDLHPDLNVLTGRNGSGKTTILKLIWYVVSGNIQLAILEVPFSRVTIVTDLYSISIQRLTRTTVRIFFRSAEKDVVFEDASDDDGHFTIDAEDQADEEVRPIGSSIFFPTFRRIEGGFTLSASSRPTPSAVFGSRATRQQGDIPEAFSTLSRRLSHSDHTFVASVSTSDIVDLLMQQYTAISSVSNALQSQVSQSLIEKISQYQQPVPISRNGGESERRPTA
jgi:hypothetical protein